MNDEQMATLREATEGIVDGWYADTKIDWTDFLDRLEDQTGVDLGMDMQALHIVAIQNHARAYKRL
jgi:hypothetical protein